MYFYWIIICFLVGGHDSKEDAVACMELILWKVKEEAKLQWMKLILQFRDIRTNIVMTIYRYSATFLSSAAWCTHYCRIYVLYTLMYKYVIYIRYVGLRFLFGLKSASRVVHKIQICHQLSWHLLEYNYSVTRYLRVRESMWYSIDSNMHHYISIHIFVLRYYYLFIFWSIKGTRYVVPISLLTQPCNVNIL